MNSFEISVLSSSSERNLSNLIAEVWAISRVKRFDLFLLRKADMTELGVEKETSFLDYIANERNISKIRDWVGTKFNQAEVLLGAKPETKIASFATYIPEIASSDPVKTRKAVQGLANCVRLAHELVQRGWMEVPIVEIVCGTTTENFERSTLHDKYAQIPRDHKWKETWQRAIVENDANEKRKLILDRLALLPEKLAKSNVTSWMLSLELEPGNYLLNGLPAIEHLFNDLLTNSCYSDLSSHVGLNLDIAHMKIAGVESKQLKPFAKWIAHAHVCDHPGMHTRDQVIGVWDPVDRVNSGFYDYLCLFSGSQDAAREEGRLHSKAVAIELEGCNRIMWIHESVVALRHMQLALEQRSQGFQTKTTRIDESSRLRGQHENDKAPAGDDRPDEGLPGSLCPG